MFEYVSIGKVLKPYRKSGEILADLEEVFQDDLQNCKAVFIKISGLEVPFFIEYIELSGNTGILKLEEMNSPEDVRPFNGEDIYLRTIDITVPIDLYDQIDEYEGLEGFLLKDTTSGLSFEILRLEQYPQQMMAVVQHQGRECLVPMAEELIADIDEADRTITLELPEGLFSIIDL